jgi:hypothetical protein
MRLFSDFGRLIEGWGILRPFKKRPPRLARPMLKELGRYLFWTQINTHPADLYYEVP